MRPLSPALVSFLKATLGPGRQWQTDAAHVAPPSRLTAKQVAELVSLDSVVGTDEHAREYASRGMAFIDVVGARAARLPDAVVRPRRADTVQPIIDWCVRAGVSIVPRGGGTSVVGGLVGPTGIWVSLDLSELRHIGPVGSGLVTVQPGVTGPQLEDVLAPQGLIFGHFPQSWERATIGGYAATRSAGQNSTGYGRIEDLVVAAHLATPIGPWRVGSLPASAMGPDLLHLALGSEGTLGVFTSLTLRVRPRPTLQLAEGGLLPNWQSGMAALHDLAQVGCMPAVLRLSDPAETAVALESAPHILRRYTELRGMQPGCLLIADWHGSPASVYAQRHDGWRILRAHGAIRLGRAVGSNWRRHRFEGPYTRDHLIDLGYFVETFETATGWADLHPVYEAVADEVRRVEAQTYLMAHISHVYPTGASLYFTLVGSGDVLEAWPEMKGHLTSRLRSLGATASHHHGVGTDHAPWLTGELGSVGMRAVRAVKQVIDPTNIMNPEILDRAP